MLIEKEIIYQIKKLNKNLFFLWLFSIFIFLNINLSFRLFNNNFRSLFIKKGNN